MMITRFADPVMKTEIRDAGNGMRDSLQAGNWV